MSNTFVSSYFIGIFNVVILHTCKTMPSGIQVFIKFLALIQHKSLFAINLFEKDLLDWYENSRNYRQNSNARIEQLDIKGNCWFPSFVMFGAINHDCMYYVGLSMSRTQCKITFLFNLNNIFCEIGGANVLLSYLKLNFKWVKCRFMHI